MLNKTQGDSVAQAVDKAVVLLAAAAAAVNKQNSLAAVLITESLAKLTRARYLLKTETMSPRTRMNFQIQETAFQPVGGGGGNPPAGGGGGGNDYVPNGTSCPVENCGAPQYQTPSGLTCENGHGGVSEGEPL